MKRRRLPSLVALRAFEAVVRLGSARDAAAELSVTPTAISHQIRLLEEELGTELFVRRPRQLLPTAQARALAQALESAFDTVHDAVAQARRPATRACLTVSTTPAIAVRCLMPALEQLRASAAWLDVRVHATHEPVALDGLTADVAIRYGLGPWPGLRQEPLFTNVFAPVCSPRLGLSRAADLVGQTLLHFEPYRGRSLPMDWRTWQAQARVPGLDLEAGPTFTDETHIIGAVMAGQGVALMSLPLIARELAEGSLHQPFGPALRAPPFQLVYPAERADEPAVAAVCAWIRACVPPPQVALGSGRLRSAR
ncbi:LysR family transcriptional regulator [Verticiella sediminum]|uniref:LysR family transcriptional regulator n=1 Tax=Verticiella sediminum TaxID=1247510 RepID=A0A556AYG0_9BURK|nr:LysR substrate-binding domain-containing protein [Verticiella sediminum]TSH97926.1 LysR family transcriptional regulator [Verticiella sediminum]